MTEQEKMLSGKIYDSSDEILSNLRGKAHKLSQQYNNTLENESEVRKQISAIRLLKMELLGLKRILKWLI